MTTISARVEADSISPGGKRLTAFVLTYLQGQVRALLEAHR